jgi:hypothetical protein
MAWEGQQKLHRVHHPSGTIIQHENGHFFPELEPAIYERIFKTLNGIIGAVEPKITQIT